VLVEAARASSRAYYNSATSAWFPTLQVSLELVSHHPLQHQCYVYRREAHQAQAQAWDMGEPNPIRGQPLPMLCTDYKLRHPSLSLVRATKKYCGVLTYAGYRHARGWTRDSLRDCAGWECAAGLGSSRWGIYMYLHDSKQQVRSKHREVSRQPSPFVAVTFPASSISAAAA